MFRYNNVSTFVKFYLIFFFSLPIDRKVVRRSFNNTEGWDQPSAISMLCHEEKYFIRVALVNLVNGENKMEARVDCSFMAISKSK